jgi:hypothetical protein
MNALKLLVAGLLLVLLAGCTTFDARYEAALVNRAQAGVEGAWAGRWQSETGHGGDRLRAVVTQREPQKLHVIFRAHFWGIFDIDEVVDLNVTSTNPVRASGEANLGYLKGGVYSYEATITPVKFDATYKSKYDHGVFNLSRPVP